ncbi:hypothetical protein [Endozoicomonas sp. ONNA1]|uniref:hypothetical protein n=1 Tax=Endozoicomonas sp. ONNA1 TaxID=2828740 RepID=UPI0021481441|nr:hypothetical protein [Endozoicomonas sp. ONNA1]
MSINNTIKVVKDAIEKMEDQLPTDPKADDGAKSQPSFKFEGSFTINEHGQAPYKVTFNMEGGEEK